MSPLNRGPLMGPRLPPAGARQLPPPRFVGRLTPHGMPPRMLPPPLNPLFGPGGPRQRLPLPPRPASGVARPNGMLPRFPGGPRAHGMAPIVPSMGPRASGLPRGSALPRGTGLPRGPPMRTWPRRMPPPQQMMPPMRLRFNVGNGNVKGKTMANTKKVKIEELELKKPWMTDEIRNEIQRKNKLYAKAKKNKDAIEWEEFKDLRNKVTRMIRDAKNEYLAKHPEQGDQKTDDNKTIESEGVQKTENSTEKSEQTEQTEETQPSSEQTHLYPVEEESYDQRDENYVSSDDDNAESYYCEVCDRDFPSEIEHKSTHMLCGIDGCTFSAHPLLVQKHINMQHRTGLYQRIKNFSTPEDIEKWLMERKKKYPTEDNIKLRKAEELEKLQRGEIIKQNSNVHTKKKMNVRDKKRKPRKRHAREINNFVYTEKTYRGLQPFPGITILQEEKSAVCSGEQAGQTDLCGKVIDNISDEDDVPQISTVSKSTNSSIINSPVLPILVADYESEDNDEGPEEIPIKKMKGNQDEKITDLICEENSTQVYEETSNMQSCTDADDKSNNKSQNTIAKNQDKYSCETNRILINNKNAKILHRYHNKLLEKLLSRSIQHERNLICQCIKFIIENNFFD